MSDLRVVIPWDPRHVAFLDSRVQTNRPPLRSQEIATRRSLIPGLPVVASGRGASRLQIRDVFIEFRVLFESLNMPTPHKITSLQNDLVKRWASLRDAKYRHKEQLFLLEGTHLVDEALKSALRVVAVCSSDSSWINGLRVPDTCRRFAVTAEIIAKCCSTETPQPAFAVAELPAARVDFDWRTIEIALLLDRVQDPGNMGAALRAAAAVGVDVVVIGDGCADLFAPKSLRAAMGASFRVPVVHRDLAAVLPELRNADCRILASVLREDATDLFRLKLHAKKVAWIVGNEGNGIRESLLSQADALVTIPMLRRTESLNAAQATAILLYETARQKKTFEC
jgi:RNA methyltransferase, TrmH family